MSSTEADPGPWALSAPRLDDQLCFALYAASRLVVRAYGPVLDALGLTYPQYLAMLVLWEADDTGASLTVRDIGARLHLDSATLTPLLKRLEAAGFTTRTRDRADQRAVRVGLTEAGRALATRAAGVPEALLCRSGEEPERLVALRDTLAALTGRLAGG
ncbi:MAG: MarR family transcriptional regulator [Myxococcota bacterium]